MGIACRSLHPVLQETKQRVPSILGLFCFKTSLLKRLKQLVEHNAGAMTEGARTVGLGHLVLITFGF